jgi:RNA polymerase sigma factor (sigma-70 family)
MANRTLGLFLQHLRRVARTPENTAPTDGQLLERFAVHRDEAAFAALLQRHAPMVLGVCRRILPDPNDVDDAFQATFLVLVRKASAIAKWESVGSWLHGVAHRVALRARLQARQRWSRESSEPGAEPQAEGSPDPLWPEVCRVLDEELLRLPDKYRAPLVLCYLEGKTNDEAAVQLGWTRGTIAGRLNRARALLRGRLLRRGVGIGPATLEQLASVVVPAVLMRTTAETALAYATGAVTVTAGTCPQAIVLAEGVLKTMRALKLRLTVAVLVVLGILGAGAGLALHGARADQADSGAGTAAPAGAPAAPAVAPAQFAAPQIVHKPAVVWTGPHSMIDKGGYLRISERKDWEDLWKRHVGTNGLKDLERKEVVVPEVNFEAYMVVALLDGDTVNSAGFSAFSILEDNEQLVFRFQGRYFQTAGPDGGAIAVRPYGFFVVPRSTKQLVLERDVRSLIAEAPKWKEVARFQKVADEAAIKKEKAKLKGSWELIKLVDDGKERNDKLNNKYIGHR